MGRTRRAEKLSRTTFPRYSASGFSPAGRAASVATGAVGRSPRATALSRARLALLVARPKMSSAMTASPTMATVTGRTTRRMSHSLVEAIARAFARVA